MNIHLHIERLILDGLPMERNQAAHVQAAVEAELTRLLRENGLAVSLHAGGAIPSIGASTIRLGDSNPAHMGNKIAQSVYSGIGNTR